MPIFHCLGINYKEMRYLAYPKRLSLNSLGRDLIYHLGFFINWYANFLIFPFDWYFFVMTKSVFLLANMYFRRRSVCLQSIRLAGLGDVICHTIKTCTYTQHVNFRLFLDQTFPVCLHFIVLHPFNFVSIEIRSLRFKKFFHRT